MLPRGPVVVDVDGEAAGDGSGAVGRRAAGNHRPVGVHPVLPRRDRVRPKQLRAEHCFNRTLPYVA